MTKILAVLAVSAVACMCFAQDKPQAKQPQALAKAMDSLNRELNNARIDFVKRQIEAYKKHRETLEQAKKQAMEKKNLEDAVAYDKAIKDALTQIDSLNASLVQDPVAEIKVTGTGFQVQNVRNGERAFSNRDYVWGDVPQNYEGWSFTRSDGKGNPSVKVEAMTAGLVTIAVGADYAAPRADGWRRLGKDSFFYTDSNKTRLVLFAKEVAAGDVIDIPTRPKDAFISPILLIPPPAG